MTDLLRIDIGLGHNDYVDEQISNFVPEFAERIELHSLDFFTNYRQELHRMIDIQLDRIKANLERKEKII